MDRYERLDAIERCLARRPEGWTVIELAKEFEVNATTIYRDLQKLEERGTGFIKQGSRYLLDHRRALHTVKMNHHEVLALFLAARLLSRHSDEHNPHVVAALEKLADAMRAKAGVIAQHIDQAAAVVRQRRMRQPYVAALEVLTQAWAEQRKVLMNYRSANGEHTERIVAPYFIEPSSIGYACHVIGYDELRENLRTFKVERINTVQLTDQRFTIPADFDPQRLLANAWGVIWRDDDSIEVQLRFAPSVVRRVYESVWHHSQRIEDLPDGACLFTVLVGNTLEMRPWIRQWGAAVEVLAPPDLRAELTEEAHALARLYEIT